MLTVPAPSIVISEEYIYPEPSIEELILQMNDGETMLKIAMAESSLIPTAQNSESSAGGLFQIIDGTWEWFECKGEKYNPYDNIECAEKIRANGLHHWDASKHAWSKA